MSIEELLRAMEWLKVETGSLACLGCECESNCSVHGCRILREAIAYISILEQKKGRWIQVTERFQTANMVAKVSRFSLLRKAEILRQDTSGRVESTETTISGTIGIDSKAMTLMILFAGCGNHRFWNRRRRMQREM